MLDQFAHGLSSFESLSLSLVIFTLLLTVLLGTAITLTYKFTFRKQHYPGKLFQQIILSSTVSALVMVAAGETIALGLAILGAFFFIFLRDQVQGPRNALFIFAAFVMGIATGEFKYTIAVSGTIIFCYIVVLLYYPPPESNNN